MTVIRTFGRRLRDIDFVVPGVLEKAMLHFAAPWGGDKVALPLVAIVGPPRVGSTLMYQLLVSQYRFFYFDNFQHALLRYPYLVQLGVGLGGNRYLGTIYDSVESDHMANQGPDPHLHFHFAPSRRSTANSRSEGTEKVKVCLWKSVLYPS